jgi:serine/threonine protein kinase/Tfp pilus assembly protein PilF
MIGQTIKHYKILDKLGAGGMGEVYLAEDTDLQRRVALKFLPPEVERDTEARERLLREARAASRLNHPNVLTIHAVESDQDRSFIVMEYVEGDSLKKLIRDGVIRQDQFYSIAMQVCDGMTAAHEAGLVHRDIKSDNIMVTSKGRVKVMDFGLATWRGADGLTEDGSTMGTMAYMSPEQVQGLKVDQRSDIFSLGVVLYEMLTGKLPFAGEHQAAIIYSIAHEDPDPLARFVPSISPGLEALIAKALDKDPETRYQSTTGVNADLRREKKLIDSGDAIPVYRSGPVPEAPPRRSMRRFLIPASALAIIALLFLITKPWKFEVEPSQDASAEQNRLAVMYFENLADPADAQRLGKIVTNLVITDLSESHYVRVLSSQRLYDILKRLGIQGAEAVDHETATQIAGEAGAKWMLLGSILQVEPIIVLTAQLVEVNTGSVIASQRITGTQGEAIFPLVDKLTQEIRNDLALPEDAKQEPDPLVAEVTTHSTEAYGHYLDGIEAVSKLYTDEARESFRRAVEIDSNFAMAYFRLANVEETPEKRQECIERAVQNIDRINKKERLYILAGEAEINGDNEKSARILEELITEYPDEKEAYLFLAYIYRLAKDHERTIEYLSKVIEIDPLYKDAYNLLAYEYDAMGEFENSIAAINKYLELAPNEANPYDTRGDLYAYNGELDLAIESYKDALRIKPDFAHSLRKLGHMYLFKRDYANATASYKKLTSAAAASNRSLGRTALVTVQTYQGKFDSALVVLDRAIAAEELEGMKNQLTAKYYLKAAILAHQGKTAEALAAAERALATADTANKPQIAQAYLVRAYALALEGKMAEAQEAIGNIESILPCPDSAALHFMASMAHGWANLTGERYAEAAAAFQDALTREENFTARIGLGRAYLESDQLGEAVGEFEEALKRYDDSRVFASGFNVKAHYWLGLAYEKSGWVQKAIGQYQTFLNIWKNADSGIAEIGDAKARLTRLQTQS